MPSEASLANLKPAWQPGQGGFTGRQATGYRRVLGLARKNSAEAMKTIIGCLQDTDPRVRLAAATVILERAWGKPKEHLQVDGTGPVVIVTGVPRNEDVADATIAEERFTIEYDPGDEEDTTP